VNKEFGKVVEDCRYTKDHEWGKKEGEEIIVGITDYAQDQLGDVVFLELPEIGRTLKAGEQMAVVESVKAASDIYAPISGTITARNEKAVAAPELLNSDPFGEAWLVRLKPDGVEDFGQLMSSTEYQALINGLVG